MVNIILIALCFASTSYAFQFGWGGLKKVPPVTKPPRYEPITKGTKTPVLTVTEPSFGGRIHLVGVSHGSATSANLVKEVMEQVKPSAVVLELCSDRFFSISLDSKIRPRGNATLATAFDTKVAMIETKRQQQQQTSSYANFPILGVFSQLSSVFKFASGQGVVGGIFVILGLFVSNLQRMTRSNTGGDEFVTAMIEAERLNIPVRLGDAPQNDTLNAIRGILSKEAFVPAKVAQGALFLAFSALGVAAEKSNQRLARLIPDSALKTSEWVSIPGTYAENASMLKSLMPLFATLLLTTTFTYFPYAEVIGSTGDVAPSSSTLVGSLLAMITADPPPEVEQAVSSLIDVLSLLVLIRMAKLIGTDRDCIIAKNVQATAAEFPGKDIVVVIGMLHCNGVARWLLSGVDPLQFNAELAAEAA